MLLHTFANILVQKLFGNDLVRRFSYLSHTIYFLYIFINTVNPASDNGSVFILLSSINNFAMFKRKKSKTFAHKVRICLCSVCYWD